MDFTFPRIVPLKYNHFVGKELLRRKNLSFGKGASPRAVWVRAISNAYKINSEGEKVLGVVGNRNVLVGGLLTKNFYTRGSFEMLYRRPGQQIQDKPIPGIDSINVTSKGEVQSLRKVTIEWTCPNLEDLDELAPYWLSPGITVWLEWGWSEINKMPVTVPINNPVKLKEYYEDAKKIYNEIILPSNGNHDAYLGIITNFSFTQNDDGSWSCTTELTSLGQTLIGLDLNKDKIYRSASINPDAKKQLTQNIKGFVKNKFSKKNLQNLSIPDEHPLRKNYITWKQSRDVLLVKNKTYVTWRFIEQAIVNQQVSLYAKGEGGKVIAFQMNSEGVEISNDPLLYTTNADVGLVIHGKNELGAHSFDVPNNQYAGYLTNLYFNADKVKDVFLEAETLEEALNKLLLEISSACADIWDFKLQPNPNVERDLQVIDLKFVSPIDLDEVDRAIKAESVDDRIISFGGHSGESILSSVSFTSKLTEQLALQYVVARNKDKSQSQLVMQDNNDAGLEAIFGEFRDRILDNLEPHISPPEIEEDEKKDIEEKQEKEGKRRKDISIKLTEFIDALKNNRKPNIAESGWPKGIIVLDEDAKEVLVEYINRNLSVGLDGKVTENVVRDTPLYPLEISVTIDGISGILPGNCFTLDNIPKMYKESGVFQIVEVGHDVSGDDWVTNLRCFFRLTTRKKSPIIFYDENKVNNETDE